MTQKRVSDLLSAGKEESWFEEYIVNHAPLIMAVFANIMVIVADVRVYDVIYTLTSSWWKALSASAACAIPFLLWEISWQYNSTTEGWRTTSLLMAGVAFVTSIFLGVADYLGFDGIWADWLLGGVVVMTGIHTIVGLLYFYNDPDVARRRHKKQALAAMADQELNAQVATQLLESGSSLLGVINALEKQYGPDEVEKIVAILQGKRTKHPSERPQKQQQNQQPRPAFAQDTRQEQVKDNGQRPANPPKAGQQ